MLPFELIPSQCFNVVDIERDNERMKAAMTLRFDHVRMVLSENKKRFPEGVEFLGRRGKDQQRTEESGVDSYKECAIAGCSNMCMFDSACAECGISTCSQREHSEHASHIGLPLKDKGGTEDAAPEPQNKKKRQARTRASPKPVAVAAPSAVASSVEDPRKLREEIDVLKAMVLQFMSSRSSSGSSS